MAVLTTASDYDNLETLFHAIFSVRSVSGAIVCKLISVDETSTSTNPYHLDFAQSLAAILLLLLVVLVLSLCLWYGGGTLYMVATAE